jgi:hypothetical protein
VYGDGRHGGRRRDTRVVTAPNLEFQLSADFQVSPLADGAGGDARPGALAAAYRAAGVVFAANVGGLSGRPAIGHFTVTIEPFEDVDPRTAALAIAEILSAGRAIHRAVKLVRLPCGPAVATEEIREVATLPEAAAAESSPGEPAPATEPVRKAAVETAVRLGESQVFVKPAGCPGLVVLTMATLAVSDLGWYTRELAFVAQSLRFT